MIMHAASIDIHAGTGIFYLSGHPGAVRAAQRRHVIKNVPSQSYYVHMSTIARAPAAVPVGACARMPL